MKSRSSQSRTVSLLLLVVMAALGSRHLLALLPDQAASFAWQTSDVLRAIGMSAALGICVTLTPWRMFRFKCLIAALCGYYISDVIVCATWYAWDFPSPTSMVIIQGASFMAISIASAISPRIPKTSSFLCLASTDLTAVTRCTATGITISSPADVWSDERFQACQQLAIMLRAGAYWIPT